MPATGRAPTPRTRSTTSSTGWTASCAGTAGRRGCGTTTSRAAARSRRDPGIVTEWWIDLSPLSDLSRRPPGARRPRPCRDQRRVVSDLLRERGRRHRRARPAGRRARLREWEVNLFQGVMGADDEPDLLAPGRAGEPRREAAALERQPRARQRGRVGCGDRAGLRMLAQKTWDSPLLTPAYSEFREVAEAVGAP